MERAVERSQLPRLSADLLFFFARKMQKGTVTIPLANMPSLGTMARATKWSRRHLQRGLNYLEELGLIVRTRPSKHDARVNHARTAYAVVWPALEKLGTARPEPPRAMKSRGLGTGRRTPRDRQSAELGTDRPEARDTTAHDQTLSDQQSDQSEETAIVIRQLEQRTGKRVTEEWAAQTAALILARPGIKNRRAYLIRTLVTDPDPQRWLPTSVPPPFSKGES